MADASPDRNIVIENQRIALDNFLLFIAFLSLLALLAKLCEEGTVENLICSSLL